MEAIKKYIIIGAASLFVILSISINLQVYNSKKILEREKEGLQRENTSLLQKVEESNQLSRRLEEKIGLLNKDLEKITHDKEELQKQYDLVEKARQELLEKFKEQAPEKDASVIPPPLPPLGDDYWAAILKQKTELELQLQNVRNGLREAQVKNTQLEGETQKLVYNKQVLDSLAAELVKEKNDKLQIQSTLRAIKNENAILKRQLKSVRERKAGLEKELRGLQKENLDLKDKVDEIDLNLKDKAFQLEELQRYMETGEKVKLRERQRESVELPPIVVRPELGATTEKPASFASKVLTVNRENHFVIIDVGEEAGIKAGDTLHVYREDKAIATIQVIQVRPFISACDIKKELISISIGDLVR